MQETWNITGSGMDGYYDGAPEETVSHHTTVKYTDTVTTQRAMITATESSGWDWLKQTTRLYNTTHSTTGVTTAHLVMGAYVPPEGLSGSYNVCLDYASAYSNRPDSVRLTMPEVDLSGLNNISSMKAYLQVFKLLTTSKTDSSSKRSGDDPSDLGDYARESEPLFSTGTITGADTGVELGGNYAAADFEDITITSPNDAGFGCHNNFNC